MRVLVILLALLFGVWWFMLRDIEEPGYNVLSKDNNIELRQYQPALVAATVVAGEQDSALRAGFKVLAAYISKNNIAMTAPVEFSKNSTGWKTSFFMPKNINIKDLPPASGIVFEERQSADYIVLRFSGLSNMKRMGAQALLLLQYAQKHGINTNKVPIYAYYNPPWTLPFLRRNEIKLQKV